MKRLGVAVILAVTLLAPSAKAGPNDPTTLYLDGRHIAQPVDWQTWCGDCVFTDYTTGSPWTTNPGWVTGYTPPVAANTSQTTSFPEPGCLWDSDDWFDYKTNAGGSTIAAGANLVATECRWRTTGTVGYGGWHTYTHFSSSSGSLVFTIKWDWGTGSLSHVVPAVLSGQEYRYDACLTNPGAPGGVDVPVPGSHDGHGIWEVVTFSISNPGRKASKTGGIFGMGVQEPSVWCGSFSAP